MKAAVIVFPGSNCDRDIAVALAAAAGKPPEMIWHRETSLPRLDLIVLPGGFSYGDYLRSGAMAAQSPVMREVARSARDGTAVLGICNGFQTLTECSLLPGVLMRNRDLRFLCRDVALRVESTDSAFTGAFGGGEIVSMPIAHNEGNYFADRDTLDRLEGDRRIAFRYLSGERGGAPNGAARDIAGIFDGSRRILGMMPHPERAIDEALGGSDGARMLAGLAAALS